MGIAGFKSFPDRTTLEFAPGVSAIVGPNGSGKSNVVEAIRWALGEQSPRQLRGGRMEDVIFSGTDQRRPIGLAEVSLTLDNESGRLPLAFREVTITRRIDRAGAGEYLINGVACRLKDILDLFADTGLGREGYFSVGQARVDEVLSSRPEDRRGLFEEAAGIVRYKQRKREALKKLEETQAALVRTGDVLAELDGQVATLGAQAERARLYLSYRDELQALELRGLLAELERAEAELTRVRAELRELAARQAGCAAQIARAEGEQERDRATLLDLEGELGSLQGRLVDLTDERSRAQGRHEVSRERAAAAEAALRRCQDEAVELASRAERLSAEEEQAAAAMQGLRAAIDRRLADQAAAEAAAEAAAAELRRCEAEAEQLRGRQADIGRRIADREGWLGSGERGAEELALRLERNRQAQAETREALAAAEAELRAARDLLDGLDARRDRVAAGWERAKAARDAHVEALAAAERREREVAAQVAAASSRLRVLTDLHREREGFQRGVRNLLQAAEHDPDLSRGLIGVLADLIRVGRRHELAMEVALGAALQNVVTATAADAQRMIDWLKAAGAGRVTFLPLDTVRPHLPRPGEWAGLDAPGVLGLALDLVEFDEAVRPAVAFALGRTVVCKDLRAALALGRRNDFRLRIVTLDGDLVNPGGSLTGGSASRLQPREGPGAGRVARAEAAAAREPGAAALSDQGAEGREGAGLLARERQRHEAMRRLEELRAEEAAAATALAEAKAELLRLDGEVARSRDELHQLEVERARVDKDRARHLEAVARLGEQRSRLELEEVELGAQLAGGSRLAEQWRRELDALRQEAAAVSAAMDGVLAARRAAAERREAAAQESTAAQVELASLRQQLAGCEQEGRRRAEQRAELDDLATLNRAEQKRLAAEIAAHGVEAERACARAAAVDAELRSLQEELRRRHAGREALLVATQRRERELRALRRAAGEAAEALAAREREEVRLRTLCEAAEQRLRQEYGCDREAAAARAARAPALERPDDRVAELRLLMEGLEPVNLAAIDDHAQAVERRDFLAAQRDDLEAARQSLHRAIEELDARMRQRFEAAFAAIRSQFQRLFQRFFGGGRADLLLEPGSDALEGGVEIVAQPPGKRLQSLSLLSGGERALTAIALIFAMLAVKPAPFCLLDEIDAALDEANVQRFARVLREFGETGQFIVVTHQKGTMAAADRLYGVTMEERGVSRLVSVRLTGRAGDDLPPREPMAAGRARPPQFHGG